MRNRIVVYILNYSVGLIVLPQVQLTVDSCITTFAGFLHVELCGKGLITSHRYGTVNVLSRVSRVALPVVLRNLVGSDGKGNVACFQLFNNIVCLRFRIAIIRIHCNQLTLVHFKDHVFKGSTLSVIGYISLPEKITRLKHSGAVIRRTIRPVLNVLLRCITIGTANIPEENVFVSCPCSTVQVTKLCMFATYRHNADPHSSVVRVRFCLRVIHNVKASFIIPVLNGNGERLRTLLRITPRILFVFILVNNRYRSLANTSNSSLIVLVADSCNTTLTGAPIMVLSGFSIY